MGRDQIPVHFALEGHHPEWGSKYILTTQAFQRTHFDSRSADRLCAESDREIRVEVKSNITGVSIHAPLGLDAKGRAIYARQFLTFEPGSAAQEDIEALLGTGFEGSVEYALRVDAPIEPHTVPPRLLRRRVGGGRPLVHRGRFWIPAPVTAVIPMVAEFASRVHRGSDISILCLSESPVKEEVEGYELRTTEALRAELLPSRGGTNDGRREVPASLSEGSPTGPRPVRFETVALTRQEAADLALRPAISEEQPGLGSAERQPESDSAERSAGSLVVAKVKFKPCGDRAVVELALADSHRYFAQCPPSGTWTKLDLSGIAAHHREVWSQNVVFRGLLPQLTREDPERFALITMANLWFQYHQARIDDDVRGWRVRIANAIQSTETQMLLILEDFLRWAFIRFPHRSSAFDSEFEQFAREFSATVLSRLFELVPPRAANDSHE